MGSESVGAVSSGICTEADRAATSVNPDRRKTVEPRRMLLMVMPPSQGKPKEHARATGQGACGRLTSPPKNRVHRAEA